MAEEQSGQSQDPGLDDDSDIDLWEPAVPGLQICPYCGQQIDRENSYWVIESRDDGFYTPYCNEFHYQAHHKIGVFEEEKGGPI